MRAPLLFLAAAGAASLGATAAAQGAYTIQPASDASACARACEDDGLCVSWQFVDNQCLLRANLPATLLDGDFGASERAGHLNFAAPSLAKPSSTSGQTAEVAPLNVEPVVPALVPLIEIDPKAPVAAAADNLLGGPELSAAPPLKQPG